MESESAKDIFSDVYSDEWQADFKKKDELLSQHFEKITPEEYYRQIFGSVESPSKLLLKDAGKYKSAKNYSDAEKYSAEHSNVCLYLQSFYKGLPPKYKNVDTCYGFVVELDNVRSACLPALIAKISKIDQQPNMLVSSGNGIHAYYLFSEPFQFYAYTSVISRLEFARYNPTTRRVVMNAIMQVYNRLCDLYEDNNISYKNK